VDITVVGRRLGHANLQITAERYAHVTVTLQYDAAERFSTLVGWLPGSSASPGRCDPAVTPLSSPGIPTGPNEADLSTDSGSGARIRTVNLAVNSRLLYR
jgi:hypothetical protein